jgi:hypothetical protein
MNGATVSCDTTHFSNNAKLYWQYNCDKIWLTLENVDGQKTVIDEVPVELYSYTYRLGFHLIREFNSSALFRSGCPANGPCIYILINKTTGKKIREFGQLICIDTDVKKDSKYKFDFVVYADSSYKNLVIDFIDKKKELVVPFDFKRNNVTAIIPEYEFDEMKLNGNTLTLFYNGSKNGSNLQINLEGEKYSR